MIRHAICTVSAAATLAVAAAAPAVACDQPTSTASPQAQQEHAQFAEKGFFRHHHHRMRRFEQEAQLQSTDQQASGAHQGNCDHGNTND